MKKEEKKDAMDVDETSRDANHGAKKSTPESPKKKRKSKQEKNADKIVENDAKAGAKQVRSTIFCLSSCCYFATDSRFRLEQTGHCLVVMATTIESGTKNGKRNSLKLPWRWSPW